MFDLLFIDYNMPRPDGLTNELSALVAQILIELNDLVSTDETYFAMDKDE
ncbi:hypothetical protein SPRA44_170047 [Serratia proteamaculans]|nr:hypothetical protein SPRA44_170047 [Serratia proteamaculans]